MVCKNIFVIVLILFFALFIKPQTVVASQNFTTDYHIVYTPTESGVSHALLQATLTNTTTQFYASSYKIQLGFDNISNVQAVDAGGPINPLINKTPDGYTIDLNFNEKAVGSGNKIAFTIIFDTTSIAKKHGKIWEINIPGIANPKDFSSFVVEIRPPPSFGNAAFIKPQQPNNSLIFSKDQLGKSGISISFGDDQLYAFHLMYHIANKNVYPITSDIALPPSTNYQDVYINAITPHPKNVSLDKDGNWIAHYSLLPSQKLDIDVLGQAAIHLAPKQEILSNADIATYTKEQPYWESNNEKIREMADGLKTPQAIYTYVVNSLKYDFSRVSADQPRLGALNTLQHPYSAVCREFTDLFIALARAEGIPAREVDGFAYSENPKQRPLSLVKDILHAWPEYYDSDKRAWIMVDPTWGNTTGGEDYFSILDYDHFAFVIKGIDSTYPLSAGGYKINPSQQQKDINVTFADGISDPEIDMHVTPNMPDVAFTLLPIQGHFDVTNNGAGMIPAQNVTIESDFLTPHSQVVQLSEVPPFGMSSFPVNFQPPSFLTNRDVGFTIRLGDKITNQSVKVAPFFMTFWGIGGISLGLFAVILLIVANKIRRVRLSRKR